VNTARVRALEGLLERVIQRAHEGRPIGARAARAAFTADDRDGLDINLVDDFPSSTALPGTAVDDFALVGHPLRDSASRLVVSDRAASEAELPPRHTPPPESGPLLRPAESDLPQVAAEATIEADIERDEQTKLRVRANPDVRHIEANLSAYKPRVEMRGSLRATSFLRELDATLGLTP
jgi:hypothetical protein